MMPPSTRPAVPPMPVSLAEPESARPAADGVDEALPPHADYNLQPLTVSSLEHYVVPAEEAGERFRVR